MSERNMTEKDRKYCPIGHLEFTNLHEVDRCPECDMTMGAEYKGERLHPKWVGWHKDHINYDEKKYWGDW